LRYDVVAGLALLASVYSGIVPAGAAFLGFGHPAVITVAAVLVISQGLQNGGTVGWLVRLLAPTRTSTSLQIAAGSGLTMLMSAVMNNVGALALMLPVTLRNAARARRPASLLLIPLSFASMLGGTITLIGTPPNLVVSGFRDAYVGQPFALFDFAAVGLAVSCVGLLYLSLIGWRILPRHDASDFGTLFKNTLAPFLTEVRVPPASPFDGKQVREIEDLCENEITIMAIIRQEGDRFYAPRGITRLRSGDELIVEGDPSIWEPLCDGWKAVGTSSQRHSRPEAASFGTCRARQCGRDAELPAGRSVRPRHSSARQLRSQSPGALPTTRALALAFEERRVRGWRSAASTGRAQDARAGAR
jgi:di/tricarboxylate transporter